MKRLQLFALVSALTVMGLASCQPVETAPEKQETGKGHSVIFNVQVEPEAATKTALRLQFIPDWRYTDTDDIHIFETASTDGVATQILKANQVDIFTEDNDQKAYFHAWFDDISVIINPSGVLTKASAPVYNYTSIMAATETEGDELRFVLPSTQYPTSTSSFDPKADFLIGQCATTYNDFIQPDQRLNLNFIRPVAIGRFAIVGLEGSSVQSVKVTFEQPIAGYTTYGKVDFEESTAEFTSDDSDKVLTLLYPEGRRKSTIFNAFFLALEGRKKAVSMEVRTDSYIFTKNYPNTTWTLNKDIFNEIVIDMSTATKTALLDQEMQFKDGEGTPVSEITYDLVENGGSVDAFDSPVFSRESACQTEVTFASNNEEVATVDADGNIALTGAAGVAVITASADGDATHKAGTASVTITVVTPEVTFYEAKGIDNDVEYLIVSNGKAVKYTATGMSFEDVTVSEGTITIDNSLLEGLLWKAAAIDATSEFATFGTHTFTCSGNKLMRESDGAGSMALAASDAAMSKYMAWNYDGAKFWNHSVNGENINDFCLTYVSADGWAFEYQSTPTTLLYTTLKPREIAFTTTAFTFDRYTDTDFTSPTIDGATYVSSDTDIAAVDPATGIVTLAGKTKTGTVTITATVAAGNGFQGASASYTIEVGDSTPSTGAKYIKVTSVSELEAEGQYLLVFEGLAGDEDDGDPKVFNPVLASDGSTFAKATSSALDVTISNGTIESSDFEDCQFTLEDGYYLKANKAGKYIVPTGTSSGSGTLTAEATASTALTVAFDNGIAEIKATNGSNYLVWSISSHYFSSNASVSGQYSTGICLYMLDDGLQAQTISFSAEEAAYDVFASAWEEGKAVPTLSGAQTTVTYASSDENVATVDPSTGEVTIVSGVKKGDKAVITATAAKDATYRAATASYTINITSSDPSVPVYTKVTSNDDIDEDGQYILVYETASKAFKPILASSGSNFTKSTANAVGVEIVNNTISSSELDDCLITFEEGKYLWIESAGKYLYPGASGDSALGAEDKNTSHTVSISIASDGIATIARTSDAAYHLYWSSSNYFSGINNSGASYAANFSIYKLDDGRQAQTISFSAEEAKYDVFASEWTVAVPTLSGAQTDVTYASSNEAVASVEPTTGAVTLGSGIKSGDKAVITATAAKTATYKSATASYTISIITTDPNVTVYTKVTSVDDLEADGQYLIVFEGLEGDTDGDGNPKVFDPVLSSDTQFAKATSSALDVTISNGTIQSSDFEDCQFTLEDGYYLKANKANKYIYPGASGSSSVPLAEATASHALTITFENGNALIKYDTRYIVWSTYSHYFSANTGFTSTNNSTYICLYKLEDNRQPQSIEFVSDSAEYDVYTNEWTVDVPSLDVTKAYTNNFVFESLNEDVATVDDMGIVTIAAGAKNHDTAVIKATVLGDETYKSATATYTITIVDSSPKAVYNKVMSSADLDLDAQYLVVYDNGSSSKVFKPILASDGNSFTHGNTANAASVTISSNTIESNDYKDCQITLKEGNAMFVESADKYLYLGSSAFSAEATSSHTHSISFDSDGAVTISRTSGSSTYRFRFSSSGSYFQSSSNSNPSNMALYKLEENGPKDRKLAFSESSLTVNIYDQTLPFSPTVPTLSGRNADALADVNFSAIAKGATPAEDIATVDSKTGAVSIVGVGTVTITAYADATDDFQIGQVSYTLTVINQAPPTYTLITSASDLVSGATYLIVATDSGNYNNKGDKAAFVGDEAGNVEDVTAESGVITGDYSDCEFVITASGSDYTLYGPNGYVTGNSGTSRYIQVSSSAVTMSLTDASTLSTASSSDGKVDDAFYFYYTKDGSKEVLYLNADGKFKIGGSGRKYGVHLYKKN